MVASHVSLDLNMNSPGLQRLKQRFPYLLVDKVVDYQERQRLVAIKNITINEPFFSPELIEKKLSESVLLEIMTQAATLLILEDSEFSSRSIRCDTFNSVTFYRDAFPGDQLRIEVDLLRHKDPKLELQASLFLEGKLLSEATIGLKLGLLPSRPQIHPSAVVHPSAILGKDVVIGPNTYVGQHVIIGDRSVLESHILVEKWTKIGADCHIHFGSVIGGTPQDKKYDGEKSWVYIGDRNQIREYVTINRGTTLGGGVTKMGDDNLILAYVHIGHDCILHNNIVISNSTNMGGHVEINNDVVIGGMTGIHQFLRVGQGAMIGGYSKLVKDIPPYVLCDGNPAQIHGLNVVGLRRKKLASEAISELKEAYKTLYRSDLTLRLALEKLNSQSFTHAEVQRFVDFCSAPSKRGLNR
ncbi:MAG: acyl-ACP--UDP-N-acetylglucosamine O-acyltransferase [bacterium]